MKHLTDRPTLIGVSISVIIATIANAAADVLMQKMIAEGIQLTSILQIFDWTPLQWGWHICKWIFFNGCIGYLSAAIIGWINTLLLGFVCFIVWEVSYTIFGCIWPL